MVDIVSDENGYVLEDHDIINIADVLKVIQHPKTRTVPISMRTSKPDMTYPAETEPRALLSCGHALSNMLNLLFTIPQQLINILIFLVQLAYSNSR